jgi:hypothetical protein
MSIRGVVCEPGAERIAALDRNSKITVSVCKEYIEQLD